MSWEPLRTDYKDAAWSGLKKYLEIKNPDGTISLQDVTSYIVYDESFFGALDANRINTAINAIMAALENGTDLYEVFTAFFENQKVEFENAADSKLDLFNIYLENLRDTANSDITQMKEQYTEEIMIFKKIQEKLFEQWFDFIKEQLSSNPVGNLQNQINQIRERQEEILEMLTTGIVTTELNTDDDNFIMDDMGNPLLIGLPICKCEL